MLSVRRSEQDTIARDAVASVGKSPRERAAMLADLLAAADAILEVLPEKERRRRARIAMLLDPLPNPWWKNFRSEALAEFQCHNSSN